MVGLNRAVAGVIALLDFLLFFLSLFFLSFFIIEMIETSYSTS